MPTLRTAFEFLEERAGDLFGSVATFMYIGHRGDTHPWWHTDFATKLGGPSIDVLDIHPGNLSTAEHVTKNLRLGDVRTYPIAGFGLVFWDEGPEHLPQAESIDVLRRLAAQNEHVLLSCPWGLQPQGTGPSDPEFHHWGPQPVDFESIGFTVRVFGEEFDGKGGGHGNLIAWT